MSKSRRKTPVQLLNDQIANHTYIACSFGQNQVTGTNQRQGPSSGFNFILREDATAAKLCHCGADQFGRYAGNRLLVRRIDRQQHDLGHAGQHFCETIEKSLGPRVAMRLKYQQDSPVGVHKPDRVQRCLNLAGMVPIVVVYQDIVRTHGTQLKTPLGPMKHSHGLLNDVEGNSQFMSDATCRQRIEDIMFAGNHQLDGPHLPAFRIESVVQTTAAVILDVGSVKIERRIAPEKIHAILQIVRKRFDHLFNSGILSAQEEFTAFLGVAKKTAESIDDGLKIFFKRNLGLTSKQKMALQILVAAVYLFYPGDVTVYSTRIWVPLVNTTVDLGTGYYLFLLLLLVGTTNAVNLTDGLDGLASSVTIPVMLAFAYIGFASGLLPEALFALSIVGCCLGFLIYNHHPAKCFMGDTGSLALGGAVAAVAIGTHTELLLVVIGGIYVLEALSVMLQVGYFKMTHGKRIFRMAPLHHHFELGGWKEIIVVKRFFLASCLFSLLGVGMYLMK